MKEAYAIYLNRDYGRSIQKYICAIKCTRDEVEKIVNKLNLENDLWKGYQSLGTDKYYSYSCLAVCDSYDDFLKYIEERKQKELEELATKRAWKL